MLSPMQAAQPNHHKVPLPSECHLVPRPLAMPAASPQHEATRGSSQARSQVLRGSSRRAGGRAIRLLPTPPHTLVALQGLIHSPVTNMQMVLLHGPGARLLGVRAPEGAGGGARRGVEPHAHLALHGNRQWSCRSRRERTRARFERQQRVAEEGGQTGSPWQPGADGRRLGAPRVSPRQQDGEPGVRARR